MNSIASATCVLSHVSPPLRILAEDLTVMHPPYIIIGTESPVAHIRGRGTIRGSIYVSDSHVLLGLQGPFEIEAPCAALGGQAVMQFKGVQIEEITTNGHLMFRADDVLETHAEKQVYPIGFTDKGLNVVHIPQLFDDLATLISVMDDDHDSGRHVCSATGELSVEDPGRRFDPDARYVA